MGLTGIIEIGNTLIKIYSFKEEEESIVLCGKYSHTATLPEEAMKHISGFERIMISSSGNQQNVINHLSERVKGVEIFNFQDRREEIKFPFRNLYTTPATLGIDRIANVCGGIYVYERMLKRGLTRPRSRIIISDAGTALTQDIIEITEEGYEYKGGNISAGLSMRLEALHKFTHSLPLVSREELEKIAEDSGAMYGTDTKSALSCGAIRGLVAEIDSFNINNSKSGMPLLLLTGGDAPLLQSFLATNAIYNADLQAIGLREIYNLTKRTNHIK